MKKHNVRTSFSVRFRVRITVNDSVSAGVNYEVNIMFEIAGREVPLALCLHAAHYGYVGNGLAPCLHTSDGYT